MAAWSKAQVCGRSPAEIVGSNPTRGMDVCCECCVLSGRGLCDELITRPEESHRLWCVVVFDLENLKNEEAMTRVGSQRHRKKGVPVVWGKGDQGKRYYHLCPSACNINPLAPEFYIYILVHLYVKCE